MGLMMWFMMRGGLHASRRSGSIDSPAARSELDELRGEVARLRAAQKDTLQTL